MKILNGKNLSFNGGTKVGKVTKKTLAVILSVGLMTSAFAGCSIEENSNNEETTVLTAEQQYEQEIENKYFYSNYEYEKFIADSILVKYRDLNGQTKAVVVVTDTSTMTYTFKCWNTHVSLIQNPNSFSSVYFRKQQNDESYDSKEESADRAVNEYVNTLGELVSKEKFSKYLVSEYGVKDSYTAVEIDEVLTKINQQLEQEYLEEQQKIEEEKRIAQLKEASGVTIEDLLKDYKSKSDVFIFNFQDQLYSDELYNKDVEEMWSKAVKVKEITYKNDKKYLVDADETKILLGGYDKLDKPFYCFVYEDEKPHDFTSGEYWIVEIIIDNKKYIIDASDLYHVLAADIEDYSYANGNLKFTYKDGSSEEYTYSNPLYQDDTVLLLDKSNGIIMKY